jgi:parallel beta-helix repeat protein
VAPDGNDSNSGSQGYPWKTIQKAADTLVAGQTVYIRSGTYNEREEIKNSGSTLLKKSGKSRNSPQYITFAAYLDEMVTIDGSGIALDYDQDGLIYIQNKTYIKISGIRVQNAGPYEDNCGIFVEESSNIIIEKNRTYNTVSSGIGIWNSSHITVDGNEVELACNDGQQECITVAITHDFEVKNNTVHHSGPGTSGGEGIDVKDGSYNGKVFKNVVHHINRLGIYVDSWDKHTYDIEVYQNVVYNCQADGFAVAAENSGLLENIKVFNNIAYNNHHNGIVVAGWGESGATHPMKDIFIINNTFYQNGSSEWGGGICIENDNVDNLVVRNNIFSQNHWFQIGIETSGSHFLTADYNLIHGYKDYDTEIRGTHFVEGDPGFADTGQADFHLMSSSIAIDRGSSQLAPATDFDGTARPQGSAVDIGAFEYQ